MTAPALRHKHRRDLTELPVRRRTRRTPLGRAVAVVDRVGMLTAGFVLGALFMAFLIACSSYSHS